MELLDILLPLGTIIDTLLDGAEMILQVFFGLPPIMGFSIGMWLLGLNFVVPIVLTLSGVDE